MAVSLFPDKINYCGLHTLPWLLDGCMITEYLDSGYDLWFYGNNFGVYIKI